MPCCEWLVREPSFVDCPVVAVGCVVQHDEHCSIVRVAWVEPAVEETCPAKVVVVDLSHRVRDTTFESVAGDVYEFQTRESSDFVWYAA